MTTNTQPNRVEQNNDVTFSEIVWQQFKKNNLALGSLWVLGGLFCLGCHRTCDRIRTTVYVVRGRTNLLSVVPLTLRPQRL